MATITTDTFLDSGTARTAGEDWSINSGARLTVRTDTRWHAGSPASMTGVIGNIFPDAGGSVLIDGTKVRWMPFDTGSGTVPAIGTTITQGGVSGYLLGVWVDYVSAPTAVGAAMPATGFLKFREVTGGAFASGALTGISANATSADVVGWVEFVLQNGTFFYGIGIGEGFTASGEWFYLADTTGSAGQTIQVPTNGGGAGTVVTAVQIETAPGSGVFEWWAAVPTASWVTTIVYTDARAKLFQSVGGGLIRIGANSGGTPIGYTPPAGCKVRVGNIFLRGAASGSRAANSLPSTSMSSRPGINGPTKVTLNKVDSAWQLYSTANAFARLYLTNLGHDGVFNPKQAVLSVDGMCLGQVVATGGNGLDISTCGGFIRNSLFYSASNHGATSCVDLELTNVLLCRLTNTAGLFGFNSCSDCTFSSIKTIAGGISVSASAAMTFNGHDYIHYLKGPTTDTSSSAVPLTIANSRDIVYEGLTFGNGGAIANCHPYSGIFSFTTNGSGIVIKNIGSFASPLSGGTNATYYPGAFITSFSSTTNAGIVFKRIYINSLRSTALAMGTANFACVFENVHLIGSTMQYSGTDPLFKGFRATTIVGGPSSSVGLPFSDILSSDTAGLWYFAYGSVPSATSAAYHTSSIAAVAGTGWSYANTVVMKTLNDFVEIETPYYVRGYTAFANVAITGTVGTANYTYAIDSGSGYGAYKTLTLANLLTESVNAAGTKMKIKATNTAATSSLSTVTISMVSSAVAQSGNLYPLSVSTLGFTNLVAGSEIRVYDGTDPATAVEIGGTESSGTTFSFTHSSGGNAGVIAIFAMGYQPIYLPYTFSASDDSILIQQVVDRNYVNP